MDPAKYEYQSDWVKDWMAQGAAKGKASLVTKQLIRRFGPLTAAATTQLMRASSEELDAIGECLLTAQTLEEALGSR